MNGWFENVLDDYIHNGDVSGAKKQIDWLIKNYQGQLPNHVVIHLDTSDLKKPNTPKIFQYAYSKKIFLGCTIRDEATVDRIATYNKAQVDKTGCVNVVFHDVEPFRADEVARGKTYAYLNNLIKYTSTKLPGVIILGYATWHKDQSVFASIVKYCPSVNITYYRPSTAVSKKDMTSYLKERTASLYTECKKQDKKIELNIFPSCEPEYSYDLFKKNWNVIYDIYSQWYDSLTAEYKKYITKGGQYIFVSKFGMRIR